MPVHNILVVDDSKSARLMLRKMLQGFGMTVDTAESAEEALDGLRNRQPDAIFMDHTMPGMDGMAALRRIKSDPLTAAIPVAMYTSRDEPVYREEARLAGAIDVLIKPAAPDILGVVLERMHQAVDAAPLPVTVEEEPAVPAPAPVPAAIDPARIEKLVIDKAESVFYNAIESQVLPLINDVVAKLRQEISASQAATCRQTAKQVCEERLAEWRPPPEPDRVEWTEETLQTRVSLLLEERLETFRREHQEPLAGLAQQAAAQACQTQLHELSEGLVRQLSARFAEAVRRAAGAARDAAVEAAREAAAEAAHAIIAENAARAASEAAAKPAEEPAAMMEPPAWWMEAQRTLMQRVYLIAMGAAAVGMAAAGLVYALR